MSNYSPEKSIWDPSKFSEKIQIKAKKLLNDSDLLNFIESKDASNTHTWLLYLIFSGENFLENSEEEIFDALLRSIFADEDIDLYIELLAACLTKKGYEFTFPLSFASIQEAYKKYKSEEIPSHILQVIDALSIACLCKENSENAEIAYQKYYNLVTADNETGPLKKEVDDFFVFLHDSEKNENSIHTKFNQLILTLSKKEEEIYDSIKEEKIYDSIEEEKIYDSIQHFAYRVSNTTSLESAPTQEFLKHYSIDINNSIATEYIENNKFKKPEIQQKFTGQYIAKIINGEKDPLTPENAIKFLKDNRYHKHSKILWEAAVSNIKDIKNIKLLFQNLCDDAFQPHDTRSKKLVAFETHKQLISVFFQARKMAVSWLSHEHVLHIKLLNLSEQHKKYNASIVYIILKYLSRGKKIEEIGEIEKLSAEELFSTYIKSIKKEEDAVERMFQLLLNEPKLPLSLKNEILSLLKNEEKLHPDFIELWKSHGLPERYKNWMKPFLPKNEAYLITPSPFKAQTPKKKTDMGNTKRNLFEEFNKQENSNNNNNKEQDNNLDESFDLGIETEESKIKQILQETKPDNNFSDQKYTEPALLTTFFNISKDIYSQEEALKPFITLTTNLYEMQKTYKTAHRLFLDYNKQRANVSDKKSDLEEKIYQNMNQELEKNLKKLNDVELLTFTIPTDGSEAKLENLSKPNSAFHKKMKEVLEPFSNKKVREDIQKHGGYKAQIREFFCTLDSYLNPFNYLFGYEIFAPTLLGKVDKMESLLKKAEKNSLKVQ